MDRYEEIKRRLLESIAHYGDINEHWVKVFIAEVDALAPCVCGETGARNCAVHNEPASVVEAYDRSCKNCGWNSEEGLAKLHCTCEEKCKEDYTRWKPRPPAPKYTCKWCGRKAISEKANTAHESACARKNVPAPAVDEATICANCLNPKAHHYDGFCYPGSGASEQSKFTPRQPAPEKDEVCECGHPESDHSDAGCQGHCGCMDFTPCQPAPAVDVSKYSQLECFDTADLNAAFADVHERLAKLEQATVEKYPLYQRVDKLEQSDTELNGRLKKLEQAAGPLGQLKHIIGAIIYDLGNINGQRSNLQSCEMWDAFIEREKARQGK